MAEEKERRRPARNRNNGTTLVSSFKQFVGNASSSEIQEFSSQLTSALNSLSLKDDADAAAADVNVEGNPNNTISSDKTDNNNSNNNRVAQRRPSEGDFYTPQPTSRRTSKAGDELVASMKQTAAELLAELGDISDDDDDDEIPGAGGLGLGTLRE